MSVTAIAWAFRQKCKTPAEKLVLIALADQANDNGICWPGQEYLAGKCDLSRERICRFLRSLEDQEKIGSVRRKDTAGRDVGKQYILKISIPVCNPTPPGVTIRHTGVTNGHIGCDNPSHHNKGIEPSLNHQENHGFSSTENFLPPDENFSPDRITSDTPLPPTLQHEWNLLTGTYPRPRGIIKGRDRAVRLFAKSAERCRIIRNAGHYFDSSDVRSGFVMALDRFVDGGYRDYDMPEQPLGSPAPDYAWKKDIEQAEREMAECDARRARERKTNGA